MTYAPFVISGGGRHREIDLPRLTEHVGTELESHSHITSPEELVSWERRRAHLERTPRARPTDLFVWARGEAPERDLTQVGGTPYLPVGAEWPRFGDAPATFLAQFNFMDSRDILPDLPGDVLLIFVKDEDYVFGEEEQFQFRWLPVGIENLVPPESCPTSELEFVIAHGIRYRTRDDPGHYPPEEDDPDDDDDMDPLELPVAQATKIGGTPFDPQDFDPELPEGTTFLCALSSIQAVSERPWPWANTEAPLDGGFGETGVHHATNQLMIADMGTLCFLLDANGEVRTSGSCY